MFNIKRSYYLFGVLLLVYLFPIIKADRYFIDDYNRSFLGYLSWSDNGRPLADIVMTILNFNTTISDLSPLTQLLGVASLFVILLFVIKTKLIGEIHSAFCALCIIICPFMLETLSYAYDSLPMLLSIACVCAPFCFSYRNYATQFLAHFILIVCSLCLYQASLGLYVIFALLMYTSKDNNSKDGLLYLICNAITVAISYVFYSKIIAKHFISGGYSINRAEMIDFSQTGSLQHFFNNIYKYIDFLSLAFPKPFAIITISLILLGAIGLSVRAIKILKYKTSYSMLAALITILSPLVLFVIIFAPLSILANPPIMSRVLSSVGAVMMFFMIYAFTLKSKPAYLLTCLVVTLFLLYSYSTVYAYGNAQKRQKDFEQYTISLMQNDVSNFSESKYIDLYGTAPTSPVSSLIVSQHPVMAWMVLPNITFRDEWRTNITLSNFRFQNKYKKGSYPGDVELPLCGDIIRKYNGLYTLFKSDGVLLFYFKETCK
ncbi:glucosyltransferase domain-containing protein [Yersinia kristensenii]|uniref:glucosyltransferase domain-containing protein n=1 Tax=Yersinia kristensenii TaxID=28152 RepID=UPI001C60DDBB|nr:glucosyltransferase domain-containing protein [Yersinia kristensenii]MBW5814612.1 glucosyltransferase domain-containing protein [Yersinia kristensenii]MBW5818835.1 glucosyltransferase domain-containing protein [Yersinia kristensenii]MBW5844459.1 glucosyltransferase domain-containing protein [Yersinia kristensenii]MDA5491513.1 glucosyltransferase domain-containing protein [Yersinia kristensenii]